MQPFPESWQFLLNEITRLCWSTPLLTHSAPSSLCEDEILLRRVTLRWAGAAWILLLVVISLQPLRPRATIRGTSAHVVVHILAFGLAAAAPLRLSVSRLQLWLRTLYLLGLAAGIEIGQAVIYHQHTEWTDFEADGIGITIALLAILIAWNTRGGPGDLRRTT